MLSKSVFCTSGFPIIINLKYIYASAKFPFQKILPKLIIKTQDVVMQYLYSIAEIHNHIHLHYFHNLLQHIGQLTNEFIQKIRKAKN